MATKMVTTVEDPMIWTTDAIKKATVPDADTTGKSIVDQFQDIWDKINVNTTDPLIEPPDYRAADWTDWLLFFWRNLFPFIVWLLAMVWVSYLCFYNSRVVGLLFTRLMNQFFIKNGYFKVGSISLATISGKIMFRDFVYVTEDYSLRIQDGWLVFRWWLSYTPRDVTKEDFSNSEVRLLVLLNGLELHVYNRTQRYKELEKLFGLPSKLVDNEPDLDEDVGSHSLIDSINETANEWKGSKWRDLIPVTKVEVTSGRFVFGNHLIPSTLSLVIEESYFVYTTRPAVSPHDLFTNITKCKAENVKVILAPSPKYMGITDEPPRFMGEGFIVFQSNNLDLYYYQDEPGQASDQPEQIELANGDIIEKFTAPAWGLVIKCGKGTDFSYGPWADRQRELLYNFFYPSDYRPMEVSKRPKLGERRVFESFDLRLSTLSDAKIDVLFSKNKETSALHVNAGPGSYLEVTIPWVNSESGYVSHINGQIMHLDATTSLDFRPLAVSETLEFDVKIAYPRVWNAHQLWTCSLTGCKATVNLIYAHKLFFQALIVDWAGKARPDILKFVPYTCKISVVLKEFELLTLANEYNWIDCSTSMNGENQQLAICGETFDMTIDLPFVEFLPPNVDTKIWIQGEGLEAAFYLPDSSIHRDIVETLHKYARITARDGKPYDKQQLFSNDRKWRNVVSRANNWYECWTAPIMALSISYKYWPIPPITFVPKQSEVTTPEMEEILLSPMRPNRLPKQSCSAPKDFDPLSLEPDVIHVELEIGPSVIGLFGTLFRMLWNIKENYLGECQEFADLSCNGSTFYEKVSQMNTNTNGTNNQNNTTNTDHMEMEYKPFDARIYRPFEVTVSVALHDIQAHLMKCCNESDPPCPSVYTDRLCFELHKTYNETQLQLLIAPIVLISTDLQPRPDNNSHLKNGYLTLSSLQFRGHAMFSGVDRPLESETLEYGWLVDVQLGDIAGRLTVPQITHIVTPLQTFILQVMQTECSLQPPFPYQKCLHDLIQSVCPQSTATKLCPYAEDLKYKMVRLSIDAIDVHVVESNVAISVQLIPVKFSMCNIHSCHTSVGITALIDKLLVRQFVRTNNPLHSLNSGPKSRLSLNREVSQWLEVSSLSFGPVFIDSASLLSSVDNYTQSQNTFLKTHDRKTKRLWFLWSDQLDSLPTYLVGKCGCVGGSAFFGNNKVGLNFFNVSKTNSNAFTEMDVISKFYAQINANKDLAFGESLLHRGEYVLGLQVDTDECEDEELLDLVPFFEEQLTPSLSESMSDSKTELKARFKYGYMSRQMTSPTITSQHSFKAASPSAVTTDLSPAYQRSPSKSASFRIPSQSKNPMSDSSNEHFTRNRSLSESGGTAEDIDKSSVIFDIIRRQQKMSESADDKKVDFETNSPKHESEVFRTKSLESSAGSSASERYFSAEDLSNAAKSSSISSSSSVKPPPIVSSDSYYSAETPALTSDSTTQYYSCLTSESATLTAEDQRRAGDRASLNSSNSFISALSSHEDLALVDLRNQMEKPIPDSPLLMSSYASHLTQYVCYNWDVPPPVPHFTPTHVSTKDWFLKKSLWKPKFRVSSHGFSCLRIARKEDPSDKNGQSFTKNDFIPGSVFFEMDKNLDQNSGADRTTDECNEANEDKTKSDDLISRNIEIKTEKLTLLIKLNNEMDVKLSPLSLEGLKSFVESVTPTLASLHPISVLNHLNLNCLNEVETNNKLKKEKMLYLGQLNAKAWQTLIRRQNLKQNNRRMTDNKDTSLVANQFEESKTFKLLSFVYINKINVNLMQASIVEDLISFAALDNVKDLTCVSVMTVSVNDITFFSSHHLKQRRTLHTFMDQSSVSTLSFTEKALMTRFFSKKPKKEMSEIESLTIETVDTNLEESVVSASIKSIHIQLSRLKNSSTILKDALLTVIPCRYSKVDFKIVRSQSAGASDTDSSSRQSRQSRKQQLQRQDCVADNDVNNTGDTFTLRVQSSGTTDTTDEEHVLGFIMFECGVEDISLKGVKYKKTEENFVELKAKDSEQQPQQQPPPPNEPKSPDFVRDVQMIAESSHSSSCVAEVSTVWFNFAAPPKTPNTRKIDFTRLDWHLLSSAAPSISAWISVTDRLILSAKRLSKLSEQRVNSVIVCLMTLGLDVRGVHTPPQSKHLSRLFTPLAKSLQDDPSCQLVSALRRYYNSIGLSEEFELNLRVETLPCLSDLQRGIVALCRQWKNALYMPLYIQQSLRLRKGDKHPLRVLLEERSKQISVDTESADEETEVNDETTQLLPDGQALLSDTKPMDTICVENIEMNVKTKASKSNSQPNEDSNAGSAQPKRKLSVIQAYFPRSNRPSIAIPPLITAPFETIGTGVNKAYEYLFSPISQNSATRLMKRDESQMSLKSTLSSLEANDLPVDQMNGTERDVVLDGGPTGAGMHDNYGEENLYWWMARQQDYMKNVTNLTNSLRKTSAPLLDHDSKLNTLQSINSADNNNDNNVTQQLTAPDVSFLPTVAQMNDVHEIFHPFIGSLCRKINEETSESALEFGQFGTKVSICGRIKLFKIDIVESDQRSPNRSRSPSRHLSPNRIQIVNFDTHSSAFKNRLTIGDNICDVSAFVCDGLSVEFDLRKVKDFEKSEAKSGAQTKSDSKVCSIVIVGPDGMSQTTTLINFSVDITGIDQRVNLPLLRLLHQFTAVYENVKETRLEMRSNRVQSMRDNLDLDKCKLRTSGETDTTSRTPSSASYKNVAFGEHVTKHKEEVAISIPEDSDSDVTLVEEPVRLGSEPLSQPLCWKTMYYLLDLYQTKPETKTVIERVSSMLQSGAPVVTDTKIQIDEAEYKGSGRYEPLKEQSIEMDESSSQSATGAPKPSTSQPQTGHQIHRKSATNVVSSDQLKNFTNALIQREWTPIVVFGVCKIRRVGLLAMLSGLKLDGQLSAFHVSVTHKQKCRGSKKWFESSLNGQLGQTAISLLEELPTSQQLVVKMTVGKSQTLISCQNRKGKDANSALLTIGPIMIDIPQHPVALHGMMTRSGRQLSTTLQELRSSRQPSRLSRQQADSETMTSSYGQQTQQTPRMFAEDIGDSSCGLPGVETAANEHQLRQPMIKPIVVQFSIIVDSFTIGASLLPSLRAQYQMGRVTSNGITGHKAKFVIDVHQHTLSFNTKVLPTEANLPSSANVDLPQIHVSAEYIEDLNKETVGTSRSESFADGIVLRKGSYLNATADIGSFEHSLTTDLLNHLLLVQKVFMKEVNEVVQKMSGTDTSKIIDEELLFGGSDKSRRARYVLFSLHLRLKGIQITATTPTSSAVRLETGSMELQLSNRVQNMSAKDLNLKLFIKLQVDLNVALGQLIKNAMFEEAEPEFQQLAYFKTRICMRNALQDEMVGNMDTGEDKEAVLIALNRPLVYIQPLALDKAVLVWLNYKNAYEYWTEQRSNLNSEVVLATQQVLGKVQPITQMGSQTIGTLFLQLTVDDLGACLPITNPTISALNQSKGFESELKDALVVTLENTQISACSCGSLVSKAQFTGLCIRFADDFETSLDDWKPDSTDPNIRNLCVVSEGTYEICSRTITSHQNPSDAKWLLNVSWKMEGFDIHFDTSIGKHFSALFKTMTAIAGDEDEDDVDISTTDYGNASIDEPPVDELDVMVTDVESESTRPRRDSLLRDVSADNKKRSRIIEKELNEQVKIINDLRQLGASHTTIEQEVQRLHELEAAIFQNFRRDVIKKLRRPSVRQSSFKDRLSMGGKMFSKSFHSYNENNEFNENSGEDSPVDQFKPGSFETAMETVPKLKTSASIPIPRSDKQLVLDSPISQTAASMTGSSVSESQSSCESALTPTFSLDQSSSTTSDFKVPKIIKTSQSQSDPRKQSSLSSEYDESIGSSGGERSSGLAAKQNYQSEPNIDFELDVKIFFNSGKCVLHTKDQLVRDEDNSSKKMQKERSFSGGPYDSLLSPNHANKSRSGNRLTKTTSNNTLKPNLSSSRLKHPTHLSGQIADFTVFLIPGLDIKLHYNSKTSFEESISFADKQQTKQSSDADTNGPSGQQLLPNKRMASKKASLFAWITLHSIPDETLISPNILDFLEQALEPIPIAVPPKTPTSASAPNVLDESETPPVPVQYATYASFPVDVIVYFHVQPTVVRFCCLPVSRVECLLHMPSIDMVFSSKRSSDEDLQSGQSSPPKYTRYKMSTESTGAANASTSMGGLSVTGCLADFSLYIFHPYGGQKKSKESESMAYSDRKDSLSLQVEFVKINISRSRKLCISDAMAQSFRFSATCDIGSASFKYDMRRLNEILAFPKAWYRKTIWKRMFIGDHTISTIFSDQEEDDSLTDSKDLSDSSSEESNQTATTVRTFHKTESSNASREGLRLHLDNPTTSRRNVYRHTSRSDSRPLMTSSNPWETLVLFSVNLSKLNITMNMGNVMGNTNWLTRGLRSDGRIHIDSSGRKSYKIGLALDGSTLDAKGGIVGGIIELSQINTEMSVKEVKGNEPQHQFNCSLHTFEKRIDYMGTSILMLRVSDLDITLRDEWRIDLSKNYNQSSHPTKRPALIFIHGVLNWDQMQILMSKSTTPDIMKIVSKLEEFFTQQFHSSKRVFSSLQTYNRQSFKSKNQASKRTQSVSSGSPQITAASTTAQSTQESVENVSITTEARHHRHWQKALSLVSGVYLSTLPNPLPIHGTILGGTLELRAQNISLACFYGINFRSKSWGAFSLKHTSISFATEAQNIVNDSGTLDTHVVQNLSFLLGRNTSEQQSRKTMATVCKISRNVMFPPQFRHMHEWFHYAFSASEIDDVDRFPAVMELDIFGTPIPSTNEYYAPAPARDRRASASPKTSGDYHHTQEVIFAFPSMQLELKTEHLQSCATPNTSDVKPMVDCAFVSDFDDHIFVAVDAEAYFFLHELISSYLTEKDTNIMKSHSPSAERSASAAAAGGTKSATDSIEAMQRDWRDFVCQVWHLEPTVRLLSWAGKNIEPYGVDYILQRLGFSQARTTIPKWIQRTTMDGFDKLLAITMFGMLMKAKEDMKDGNH